MSVSVTNTDANVSGKTLVIAENAQTITGLQTFDRDPSAPFAVSANSGVVTNLDADKVDGSEGTAFIPTYGTFTPTIGGSTSESGQVHSIQLGYYVKIGRLVHIWGRVAVSTLGTITGNVIIEGLPFTADAVNFPGTVPYFTGLTTTCTFVGGYVQSGTSTFIFTRTSGVTANVANFAQADLSNSSDFIFAASYFTA